MAGLIIRGAAGLVILSGAVMGGNHYHIKKSWKNDHPLVEEVISLIHKDTETIKRTGLPIQRNSEVTGVLEHQKNWANISFDISGPEGKFRVSL